MASRAFAPQPLDMLLSSIPSLPRAVLDRLVARMIDHMNEIDGDPDFEETDLEDSFVMSPAALAEPGPGCPFSDPDYGDEEGGEHDEAEYLN